MVEEYRNQLTHARFGADYAAFEMAAKKTLADNGGLDWVRYDLARRLTAIGRDADAAYHWMKLLQAGVCTLEAAGALSTGLVRAGASTEVPLAMLSAVLPKRAQVVLRRELETPLPVKPRWQFRHIVIGGVSFSGSTIVSRLLAGCDGVKSIGESNWLIRRSYKSPAEYVDFVSPEKGWLVCNRCGYGCKVLTRNFREQLRIHPAHWYQKIAAALDAEILVSSDKTSDHLLALDPSWDFDLLVLFKSPVQAWVSHRNRLPDHERRDRLLENLHSYLDVWIRNYCQFLDTIEPSGAKRFMHFDRFAEAPEERFEALAHLFDLPLENAVNSARPRSHEMGGNQRAVAQLSEVDGPLVVKPLARADVSTEEAASIEQRRDVQVVYERLLDREFYSYYSRIGDSV